MHDRILLSTCSLILALGGCYASEPDEGGAIGAALEMEEGGLDLEDEAPLFGIPEALDSLELTDAPAAFVDVMEGDAEVTALSATPDAVRYHVAIAWGQLPADRATEERRDWSGAFVASRGAILVRRTLAFEPITDHLLPRPGPRAVPFTSVTRPHHDGLVITVIDPTPGAPEPLMLGYDPGVPGGDERIGVPVRALVGEPYELIADEAGNQMVAIAAARPVDACAHGFLMGRWHRVAEGRGRLIGRVVNADGELLGHVRGIYGVRESGEHVFFGKYIGREGEARGIFAGHYGEGELDGRWRDRSGDRGTLSGRYRESIPGPETGGHFIARWSEHTCPD